LAWNISFGFFLALSQVAWFSKIHWAVWLFYAVKVPSVEKIITIPFFSATLLENFRDKCCIRPNPHVMVLVFFARFEIKNGVPTVAEQFWAGVLERSS